MKRLEFHITYICNHACIFCSEDDRMQKYHDSPLTEIQVRTILVDRAKKGYNHVNFTGGEPSLFPNFLKLLAFAKKLGYKIYVGTNGTLFANEDFAQKALECIDELSFSIHWFDQQSCEQQTGHKKHFDIFTKKVVPNIVKYQQGNFFFSNIVLDAHNFMDWKKIINFIKDSWYPIRQALISNIAPEWLAEHNFWKLAFDVYEFQKTIPEIVEYCDTHNIILRFFGLPTCILWETYQDYANDMHWEERHTIERFTNSQGNIVLQDIYSPDNSRKRTFVEKCEWCQWREKPCTGVFKKYLDYFEF